jgi:hypothetical protein
VMRVYMTVLFPLLEANNMYKLIVLLEYINEIQLFQI